MAALTAWRIFKKKLARTAFSGTGARLYGGRWNSVGTAVVYLSESQALAERNYLLNPAHPDLSRIAIGPPEPFRFDRRLVS